MALGKFERCGTCREYDFMGHHRCRPMWLCAEPDVHGEDFREQPVDDLVLVHAADAKHAAEVYARRADCDSCEYAIVGGQDATVYVRAHPGPEGGWSQFLVSGESVPEYYATEMDGGAVA